MKNVILNGLLSNGYDDVEDLVRVGSSNFLYGGLNIVYGLEGSGKSWQIPLALESDTRDKIYIDTDGSNGRQFVNHCTKAGVNYIKSSVVTEYADRRMSILFNVDALMSDIVEKYEDEGLPAPTIILDCLSSMGEGQRINNAEDIVTLLYDLNRFAEKHNMCLILIDHATRNFDREDGFKLEGSEGGKNRTTVTINKYISHDYNKPEQGGSFVCERARGNNGGLRKMDTQTLSGNMTIDDAREWISKRHPEWFSDEVVTKNDFTLATKNRKDKWMRDFTDELFTMRIEGAGRSATKILKLKG